MAFAAEGAPVIVADLDLASARATCEAIVQQGGAASAFEVDVTQAQQVEAMLEHAHAAFGRVDVLFNNSGLPQSITPLE